MPHSCFCVCRHLQFLIHVRFLWGQICLLPPGVFAGICTSTCALPQQFLFLHPIPSLKMIHLSSLESPFPLWNFIWFYIIIFISNLLSVSLNSFCVFNPYSFKNATLSLYHHRTSWETQLCMLLPGRVMQILSSCFWRKVKCVLSYLVFAYPEK